MNQSRTSARVTLWVNRAIFVLLGIMLFVLPRLLDWFRALRPLSDRSAAALLTAFYCCAPLAALALYQLDGLMGNILRDQVFVSDNVRRIRSLRWCCLGVGLICIPAALFYPPLSLMSLIMGFLSLVVNVVCQVMKAAVAIREENDLTV